MVHIHLAIQAINAREATPAEMAIVTIGQMHGGSAPNVLPETAYMEGTIRTKKAKIRSFIKERLVCITQNVAAAFRAKAEVKFLSECPSVIVDPDLVGRGISFAKEILAGVAPVVDESDPRIAALGGGSEDFAFVSEKVPSMLCFLSFGSPAEGYLYPQHHPKIKFDESKLCIGAAIYAGVAMRWLSEHK